MPKLICNDMCIHFPVCEQKKYDFSNNDECQYYREERPKGKWEYTRNGIIYCNQCNHHLGFKGNFCPNCGADMKGERQ